MAYNKFLDGIFDGEANDLNDLLMAELLPDFLGEVRQKLYQNPALVQKSSNAITLLAKVIANDDEVNLSPFRNLTPAQLSQVLHQSKCTSLDLAFIASVNANVLRSILSKLPQLQSLNVMGIPDLALHDVDATLASLFPHPIVRKFSHTEMYSTYFDHAWIDSCFPTHVQQFLC